MPELAQKNRCTGCAACYNACPTDALRMEADYTGFLFPIIDYNKCIRCNACEKACPVLNRVEMLHSSQPQAYLLQHKSDEIRYQSTSGGAFTAIGEEIIRRGGVVFGACFDKDWIVHHTYAETVDELEQFRNSKYVQSEIRDTYKLAKKFLLTGRWVCFSGTPCQINGLFKFLNTRYEKLITVDIVCLAVPSPSVFKKYLNLKNKKIASINEIYFRSKQYGYSYPTIVIKGVSKEGKATDYWGGSESDEWLRLFLKGYTNRECCFNCMFQNAEHNSDITIWDCNNIYDVNKDMDDNKGTTNVILWTDKSFLFFGSIEKKVKTYRLDYDKVIHLVTRNKKEEALDTEMFYNNLGMLSEEEFFRIYAPQTIKIRLLKSVRYISYKMGIYKFLRRSIRALRKQ